MDASEVEESLFAASDAKLHGEMCKALSAIYCKVLSVFPSLEAARPRSKSGIQALCSMHIALEKAKNTLLHCCECSKLYLAITGDSVVLKFEKAKSALIDSLRRVEDIVPQSLGSQILEFVTELEGTVFSLDPSEKEVGDQIIALLQQGSKFDSCNDNNELETFHQAAIKLGITSSRTALMERRALKKLVEKARIEEDKHKESIVAYLLHLMRKYSKLFRSEVTDDYDSQGSAPCSPTVEGSLEDVGFCGNGHAFDRQLSKLRSFNFKLSNRRSDQMPLPPEELRCPISLQLMCDPVVIASGQTYEKICIEKWFNDGHKTCPKTQQQLPHLALTPNYCVKGLISSWCEHNGVPLPDTPPESLDLNYWRLALSETESTNNSRSVNSLCSCTSKVMKVVPLEESGTIKEEGNELESLSLQEDSDINLVEKYRDFLNVLNGVQDLRRKCRVVEQIRLLLKDDDEARIFMGANGFVEALLGFLESALRDDNARAKRIGAMALFNLAVNNNRNKELMIASGVIPLLEEMISCPDSHGSATALYLNLSCLEEAKPIIGSSTQAVSFLVELLQGETELQCKLDAIHSLHNLSTFPANIPFLITHGIVSSLQSLATNSSWTERSLAILINIASSQIGRENITASPSLISSVASLLDTGEPLEQEQAVTCLLILCKGDEKCSEMCLREGVIPSLVSISVNGTTRGRDKAEKLLMVFREQRQRDQPEFGVGVEDSDKPLPAAAALEPKPLCKSVSRKKMGRALSFLWKSKNCSLYQC